MVRFFNDEYLIHLLHSGNKEALKEFFNRYINLSRILSNDFYRNNYLPGLSNEDVFSVYEACIYLSLCYFNEKVGNFKAFWKQISFHEMLASIRDNMKHFKPGNLSFNQTIDELSETSIEEIIGMADPDISVKLAVEDISFHIEENEKSCLTMEERDIFIAKTIGHSYKEIANKLKITIKHVRYIYSKALKKLAEITRFK
ncbi:MAG: hypothetical protein LBM03_00060 [Erysipelotrichaceae bacterium]|jgi:DNA-directed RNA polymerase specialized sigma24 family protein|nr:hypothetical protein [Erysipelotrichaceae bacterium]